MKIMAQHTPRIFLVSTDRSRSDNSSIPKNEMGVVVDLDSIHDLFPVPIHSIVRMGFWGAVTVDKSVTTKVLDTVRKHLNAEVVPSTLES